MNSSQKRNESDFSMNVGTGSVNSGAGTKNERRKRRIWKPAVITLMALTFSILTCQCAPKADNSPESDNDGRQPQEQITKTTVSLADIDYFNATGSWSAGEFQDNENQSHIGWKTQYSASDDDFLEFFLDSKYAKIDGDICLFFDNRSATAQILVNIYADEQLVYTSEIITGGVRPQNFSLDTADVEWLKFEVKVLSSYGLYFGIDAQLEQIQ